MCLAVVCVEAGFSQIWSHILNTRLCIDVGGFNLVLFNRELCQGTHYWRAAYVMADLVMQWLNLVISMEMDMKVCCD